MPLNLCDFFAFSYQSRTAYQGHYTALCWHRYSDSWFEYNDEKVTERTPAQVALSQAYILIYERIAPENDTS